jgi:hypothetical protein
LLARLSLDVLVLAFLAVAACGGRANDDDEGASGATDSGVMLGAGTTGAGTAGAASGRGSGATSAGASGSGTTVGTSGAGGSSGATVSSTASVKPSPGCVRAPWTGATGQWVSQPGSCAQGTANQGTAACQAIPPGSAVPATATQGSPENRGWWVYVPEDYDPNKPYKVIYSGAGCGDNNLFNSGEDGFPYNNVDDGDAILVGLDYDTYSEVPGCYDNRDPQSNDFTFFPWLQSQIESEFCVDTNGEFFSGYSSGAWLGQQLDCAFPDKLRGVVSVTGCEPGAAGYPGAQYSPCVDEPTAAFFVKDFGDQDDTYACILPACARVLEQNGCSVTTCNPLDPTLTTPYAVPAGVTPPAGTVCVQFNGCPVGYPVVFCVTYNQLGSEENWGVVPLFWDFMTGLSPPASCPVGQGYQNGLCAPCPSDETLCGDFCGVDLQTDRDHCGVCGNACVTGATCKDAQCVCPSGDTMCPLGCADLQTDPGNCGSCATNCDYGATCQNGACLCPVTAQSPCNAVCVDEQTDAYNCGGCGNVCPGVMPVCMGGVCAPSP